MVWYNDMLDETIEVRSVTSIDEEFSTVEFGTVRELAARTIHREDFIEVMTGERQQYKNLVITKEEIFPTDEVKLIGTNKWVRVKKVHKETEPWGAKNVTWRTYV